MSALSELVTAMREARRITGKPMNWIIAAAILADQLAIAKAGMSHGAVRLGSTPRTRELQLDDKPPVDGEER